MKHSCRYCGRIHDKKFDCGKKPARETKATEVVRFRWTFAWQRKRDEIKRRDGSMCAVCRAEGRAVYDRLEVHHIIPAEFNFDMRLANDNLITLCETCHTLAEAGQITKLDLIKLIEKTHAPDLK
ncbi:MAG: HNH endonuclease [Defluviitaleaceae bacterium]|nr:HNH endonuclease [Defluviitaleaceae bacterium]